MICLPEARNGFFLYLLESDFRRLVALELDDIDIFVGVKDDVYAAS